MYRKKAGGWLKHLDFMLLDMLCLQAAFMLAYAVRMGPASPYRDEAYRGIGVVLLLADVAVMLLSGTFSGVLARGRYEEFTVTVRHVCLVEAVTVVYLFTAQKSIAYSRFVIYLMAVLYACAGYFTRNFWKAWLLRHRAAEGEKRSLLIVTEADMAGAVLEGALARDYDRFRVTGIAITDRDMRGSEIRPGMPEVHRDRSGEVRKNMVRSVEAMENRENIAWPGEIWGSMAPAWETQGIPVVACKDDIVDAVCRRWVDEALIVQRQGAPHPGDLVADLAGMGVVVHTGLFRSGEEGGMKQFVGHVGDYTVLTASISYATPLQQFAKRAMDIAGGIAGCIVTGLLFLVLAPIMLAVSPGPVFFMQERIGRNGKRFKIYKFRSMYMDAEERKKELMEKNRVGSGLMFKMEADPRIIGCRVLPDGTVKKGFGNFIRDHSLDEFPQFFNVLKGDMSLVGTRPPTPDEWEQYEPHHRARMAVRPGITGLWQVSGRSRITDFEEVVKLDTKYITEWSMGLDLRILLKTVKVVLGKDGAM